MNELQTELRDKATKFVAARGALQSAGALAVVHASPVNRVRVDALNKRAAILQKTIESAGRMVDGARRWFSDTFGISLETSAPVATTAIDGTIQSAIVGMNYFIRDANNELMRISSLNEKYQALPADQKDKMLGELHAEAPVPAAPFPISKKWLLIGGAVLAGAWFLFNRKGMLP